VPDENRITINRTLATMADDPSSFPVFAQPVELQFVVGRPETHKQVLTLYNPYEFTMRYRVLSNSPNKYKVVEPTGHIRTKCYLDILVRHLTPTLQEITAHDILRIEIFRDNDTKKCGKKDVPMVLVANELPSKGRSVEHFEGFPATSRSTMRANYQRHVSFAESTAAQPNMQQAASFYWLVMAGFVACIATLMLPTQTEKPPTASMVPVYLHPTQNLQLVAAYVLGLITIYLIRPHPA
jgi:hypothetical protein